ncbi:hypothetical protein LO762_27150 [Actinocorallia sp. API 0066]|uniref:hypothetical protein n=1 Tax=Actinocorallia sp. API 0066 TaxID=2896846 RepID=UPI001E477C42|nr:hypothetical protein [Actinocorallia sp. API 0066]MCD0452832.1 hypothetical protein [Actinocorallia sp. API 0066]
MRDRHWREAVDGDVAEARKALVVLRGTAAAAGTDMSEVLAYDRADWPPGTADAYDAYQAARQRLTAALARADGTDPERLSPGETAAYLLTALALAP